MLHDIFACAIHCSRLSFSDEKERSDLINLNDFVGGVLESLNANKLFAVIADLLQPDDSGSLYAVLQIENGFLNKNIEVARKNLQLFVDTAVGALSSEEYPESIKIQAAANLDDLLNLSERTLDSYSEQVFEVVVGLCTQEISQELALSLLNCLSTAIRNLPVKPEWYENIVELIQAFLESEPLCASALAALGDLISVAQNGLSNYFEAILEIITAALQSENSLIRANAIVVLGKMITVAPQMDNIQQAVQTSSSTSQ